MIPVSFTHRCLSCRCRRGDSCRVRHSSARHHAKPSPHSPPQTESSCPAALCTSSHITVHGDKVNWFRILFMSGNVYYKMYLSILRTLFVRKVILNRIILFLRNSKSVFQLFNIGLFHVCATSRNHLIFSDSTKPEKIYCRLLVHLSSQLILMVALHNISDRPNQVYVSVFNEQSSPVGCHQTSESRPQWSYRSSQSTGILYSCLWRTVRHNI